MKVTKIHGLGNHLVLDCYGCDRDKIESKRIISDMLKELPELIGMKRISKPHIMEYKAKVEPESGITGFVLLAESHISIHTYPKKGYFAFDIFSCKEFDTEKTVGYVKDKFSAKRIKKGIIKRGY
ncbi:adenosylmethionine decarboxylase [Candidatus Woesearchaeota archaeon]|nr:adenosylmethionine decarboxylase [Candidatus Woesearchaeota archaeon]